MKASNVYHSPLSSPTKLAEAECQDLIRMDGTGKAFVATRLQLVQFPIKCGDYVIGQANSNPGYPGLGLDMLTSEASLLTDEDSRTFIEWDCQSRRTRSTSLTSIQSML